jgi:hypothetical protein
MERITWIIIGYATISQPFLPAPSNIFIHFPFHTRARLSLILVAILVELVRSSSFPFSCSSPPPSAHTRRHRRIYLTFVFLRIVHQGEIVARLAVHTTLRGEGKLFAALSAA